VVGLSAVSASAQQWPDLFKPLPKQYSGEKDAALIISISDYAFLPDIPGANENAQAWFQHLTVTRGIPTTQVQWIQDNEATVVAIRKALNQLVADTRPGGVAWVLYIGHGAPAQDGNDGVLVAVGAQNTVEELYANSIAQKELLKALEEGKQARSVVFIDACFSGDASGTGKQLATSTMPTLPEKVAPPEGKKPVLVLSAGTSRQFAGALPGAKVPAFSYLALGAMRGWADEDSNGQVTAGEAIRYINAVMRTTVKGRTQTPQLNSQTSEDLVIGRAGKNEPAPVLNEIVLGLKTGAGGRPGEAKEQAPALAPAPEVRVTGPRVSKGSVKAVVGSLTIKTVPTGVRLDLVDPSGVTLATRSPFTRADATSGVWQVKATAEGYAPEQTQVDVPPDDAAFAELTLKQLAGLEVTGTPAGARVKVTGPEFSDEGGLPWSAEGLVVGEYTVSITREGYRPQAWKGELQPGKTQVVTAKLERQTPEERLSATRCPAGMAFVKGGTYTMGDRKDRVTVADFCMDVTEVTVAAYASRGLAPATILWDGMSAVALADAARFCNGNRSDRQNHPVNCVDWAAATAYCAGIGLRLPSEEEWEWAARGGDQGTTYPWGNSEPGAQVCWNGEGNDLVKGNRQSTCPVGSYPAGDSPLGLKDLAGNVSEWTSNDVVGPPSRLLRGGGWYEDGRGWLRAADRRGTLPASRSNTLGFRCARKP